MSHQHLRQPAFSDHHLHPHPAIATTTHQPLPPPVSIAATIVIDSPFAAATSCKVKNSTSILGIKPLISLLLLSLSN